MKTNIYKNYYASSFLLVLIGLVLTSCSRNPEETMKAYLDCTFMGNDGKKAYRLLSSEDRKYKSEREFISELKRKNVFNEKFLKKYKEHFNYEIVETQFVNEDTVKIKVALSKPNTGNLLQEMLALAMATSVNKLSDVDRKEMIENHFGKILKADEVEVETEEREYLLVKEDGSYRIFLNLGEPFKAEILNQKIEKLEQEAEECRRKIDYGQAMHIYNNILCLKENDEVKYKMKETEDILNHSVALNKDIRTGNILIQPSRVEMKRIKIAKRNWISDAPKEILSNEQYLVLTFNVKNNGEGEVIELFENSRYKKKHVVYDNFGNEMKEFLLDFDMLNVEGNDAKKIGPGETREFKAVCEAPLSSKANKFVWKMRVYNDNKKTEDFIYVTFDRKNIIAEAN